MTTLFLDLETAPAAWTLERGLRAAYDAVPGNYTKPDSIAKWVEEHAADAWLRTPLDPHAGAICCIGWAVDAEPVQTFCTLDPWRDERDMLAAWWERVADDSAGTWAGHGLKGFDLPWLMRKAIRYGLWDLARSIPWARHGDTYRTDEKRALDTKDLWKGSAFGTAPGLDDIATFLGLRTKADSGLHGSEVWRALGEGRKDDIRRYCADDVERVRDVVAALARAGVVKAGTVTGRSPDWTLAVPTDGFTPFNDPNEWSSDAE